MKLSIIIPVFNVENYLEDCINSILNQTFKDFELILINDGSKDNSGVICDEYAQKDDRVRVFHQENKGVSVARNVGLDKAKGEWIYFVDSDDNINEGIFDILKEDNLSVDIIRFGFNKWLKSESVYSFKPEKEHTYNTVDDFYKNTKFRVFTLWIHFFKRECINKYNIKFTEGLKYAEDLEFVIKSYGVAKLIKSITFVGYNYFVREDSAMSKAYTFENAKVHLDVAQRLVEFFKSNNLLEGEFLKSRIEYMIKSYFSFSVNTKVNKKQFKEKFLFFIKKNRKTFIDEILNKSNLVLLKISPWSYFLLMKFKVKIK